MNPLEHTLEPAALKQQCRSAVDALLARRSWRLLDPEEFADQILANLCAGYGPDLARVTLYTYCLALHRACSGAEGSERQNLAYTELFHYLFDLARYRYGDVAEDEA